MASHARVKAGELKKSVWPTTFKHEHLQLTFSFRLAIHLYWRWCDCVADRNARENIRQVVEYLFADGHILIITPLCKLLHWTTRTSTWRLSHCGWLSWWLDSCRLRLISRTGGLSDPAMNGENIHLRGHCRHLGFHVCIGSKLRDLVVREVNFVMSGCNLCLNCGCRVLSSTAA